MAKQKNDSKPTPLIVKVKDSKKSEPRTSPTDQKVRNRERNERLHAEKVERGGLSKRQLKRATDPAIQARAKMAEDARLHQAQLARTAKAKEARAQAAQAKLDAAKLANERLLAKVEARIESDNDTERDEFEVAQQAARALIVGGALD